MLKLERLLEIQNSNCQECSLASLRTKIVPGRGGLKAKIVGIGEAPGKYEDLVGRSFVGPAGQLLDEFANEVGINTQKDMFLTNTVMCRPKAGEEDQRENRQPSPDEIGACFPKLQEIVTELDPKLIVIFGVPALRTCLINAPARIGLVAGKFFPPESHIFNVDADVYVLFHPSYVLRYPFKKKEYTTHFARLKHYAIGAGILD